MKPQLPSGIQRGLPLLIAADGSAEQALAVFELLTDLREVIWRQYQIPIQDFLQQQARPAQAAVDSDAGIDDPPFRCLTCLFTSDAEHALALN
ncbi:MAG: hypothetical protein V7642_688, partial [Burkholderiales bacterium]|jgi:hypothetical protein